MHIAICDDNVADRKHLERLLGRESDKRKGTANLLYVDSYGDRSALLNSNPGMYDLFFIDLVETPTLAEDTIKQLLALNVQAPIAMCSSKVNYKELTTLPENTFHIDKPYKLQDLQDILEKAQHIKDTKIPMLEMRSTEGTRYVTRDSIFYAYTTTQNILVTLIDGETFEIPGHPFEFFENLKPYKEFISFRQKITLNMKYIKKVNFFSVTMNDDKVFPLSFSDKLLFQQYYKRFLSINQNQGL